ncbi:hypothetical protein YPPY100_1527, partial [Yersinia pestis PY-100]
MGRGDDL